MVGMMADIVNGSAKSVKSRNSPDGKYGGGMTVTTFSAARPAMGDDNVPVGCKTAWMTASTVAICALFWVISVQNVEYRAR